MSADSKIDALEGSNGRLKINVDDLTRQLNDANSAKARLTQENFDLQHQVQELDGANAGLAKAKAQLQILCDDLKRNLDDESRVSLSHKQREINPWCLKEIFTSIKVQK